MKCGCCILFLKDFLFTFSKTAGKDVTLRQNKMRMIVRVSEQEKLSQTSGRNQKKGKGESLSTDCI